MKVVIPELPCSFDGNPLDPFGYVRCVSEALTDYREAGLINTRAEKRLMSSALPDVIRPLLAWYGGPPKPDVRNGHPASVS